MATLFPVRPGYVVGFRDPGLPAGLQSAIKLDPEFTFESRKAIITGFGIREGAKYQFSETLAETIYVYSFGDRMGELNIDGVAFFKRCDDGDDADLGLIRSLQYYRENRLTKRTDPIKITLGSLTIEGFLIGSTHSMAQPENNLGRFSLNIASIPESDEDST